MYSTYCYDMIHCLIYILGVRYYFAILSLFVAVDVQFVLSWPSKELQRDHLLHLKPKIARL